MIKVNKNTRAGHQGKDIVCPKCNHVGKVYHFTWGNLGCINCKKIINKYDWIIKETI